MTDIESTTIKGELSDVEQLGESLKRFSAADYIVFSLMLAICTFIGLYFGYVDYRKRKRATEENQGNEAADYLMGGRDMSVIPIALSLTASFVSGTVLLGMKNFKFY